ncbi:MAG: group III truncated hemoglobin [Rhizomicrobium sp.]|nr:group III truncated hemoglobin [Rhizomicrobium sp.]
MNAPISSGTRVRAQATQANIGVAGVDEAMIRTLVHRFYAKVRQDPFIGPIFVEAIGEDWGPHLAKLCDFWSSVMLTSGRYKGNPMAVHARLNAIQPAHFEHWLALFRQTAAEVCPPEIAAAFAARADNIARSLQMGMTFRPGARVEAETERHGAQ